MSNLLLFSSGDIVVAAIALITSFFILTCTGDAFSHDVGFDSSIATQSLDQVLRTYEGEFPLKEIHVIYSQEQSTLNLAIYSREEKGVRQDLVSFIETNHDGNSVVLYPANTNPEGSTPLLKEVIVCAEKNTQMVILTWRYPGNAGYRKAQILVYKNGSIHCEAESLFDFGGVGQRIRADTWTPADFSGMTKPNIQEKNDKITAFLSRFLEEHPSATTPAGVFSLSRDWGTINIRSFPSLVYAVYKPNDSDGTTSVKQEVLLMSPVFGSAIIQSPQLWGSANQESKYVFHDVIAFPNKERTCILIFWKQSENQGMIDWIHYDGVSPKRQAMLRYHAILPQ